MKFSGLSCCSVVVGAVAYADEDGNEDGQSESGEE
jgi:hypothetical protein